MLDVRDVLAANLQEVRPVGVGDPKARGQPHVRIGERTVGAHPHGRCGVVEDVRILLGLLDNDVGRPLYVVLVADAEGVLEPEFPLGHRILDDAAGEHGVRHREQFVVEGTDLRHSEGDVLDDALIRAGLPLDPVADAKRPIGAGVG